MPGYKPLTTNPTTGANIRFHGPHPPSHTVKAKQDPGHTQADYLSDLNKATRRKATSSPRRGSSKT
jgi:hypothetical protein